MRKAGGGKVGAASGSDVQEKDTDLSLLMLRGKRLNKYCVGVHGRRDVAAGHASWADSRQAEV